MTNKSEAKEIEYKFILSEPGVCTAIIELLRSNGYRVNQLRNIHQEDLYLDTPKDYS